MINKTTKILRRLMVRVFLHGPIMRFWCHRKFLRQEKICLSQMVEASGKPLEEPRTVRNKTGMPLRKIAFIADVMWEANELLPELAKIAQVETLDLRPGLEGVDREDAPQLVSRLVDEFARNRTGSSPDVVFLYLRGGLLSEEVFSLIRQHWSCPLLGMNLDDKVSFWPGNVFGAGDGNYRKWAKKFDLNITNSQIASSWYTQANAACIYSPQGVHIPDGISAPSNANYQYPLSFLGARKLDREIIINRLRQANMPVTVFGSGWPKSKWVADANAIFRASQINLGLGLATPNLATIKGRDFECPGIGACYLTTYNWELANWWDIGKEILCYRNTEELIEIFSWYRTRPEDCLKIAQAAWRRSVAEHTWEKRFRKIFQQAGFII
jgi:Glycosyl transferases group 1